MKENTNTETAQNAIPQLDPETAYVKSMDYIDKVLAEAALTTKNLRKYQIGCAILSVVLGIVLGLSFHHIFGFLAPVFGLNITFLLYFRGASRGLAITESNAMYDRDRLKQGKLDPRVFYNHIAEALIEAKKTDYLDSLNGDVSTLSPKEKARLSKYRDGQEGNGE